MFGVLYHAVVRGRILTWGATEAEAASNLPGDELLESARGVTTRAIEIGAPAAAVWPWIAQMGPSPRAGAYTYDWIENLRRFAPFGGEELIAGVGSRCLCSRGR